MNHIDYYACVRPCFGELTGGDTTVVRRLNSTLFVAIVDVLGHGEAAHHVALTIESFLEACPDDNVIGLLASLHAELKGTRGAAAGIAALNQDKGHLTYAGIGNTGIRTFGSREVRLVSQDGVLGQNMRTPNEQSIQLDQGDVVLLFTDGVSSHFDIEDYPQLVAHDARTIATTVVHRFGKDFDDAACLALRYLQ